MLRLLVRSASRRRGVFTAVACRHFSLGTRPVVAAGSGAATHASDGDDEAVAEGEHPVEVSGRVVATDDRLLMIQPDYTKTSTRVFRPGSLVRLANGHTACLAFEAAGFSFALLLPRDSPAAAQLDEELARQPGAVELKGVDCFISSKSLTFSFSPAAVAGSNVLDCFGHPVAGAAVVRELEGEPPAAATGAAEAAQEEPIVQVAFNPAPGQFDRQVIRDNIHTGVTAMDSLTPFGRGQSMLVFGEAGTGKSTIAADVIRAQREFSGGRLSPIHCVYAATSVDDAQLTDIGRNVLVAADGGATVVASSSEDGDAGALFAVLSACALGEHHRDNGGHALVVLDEVSGLRRLWDSGWAMAHEFLKNAQTPPVEIGQLRSWYMPLLQRAAKLDDDKRGGGSMSLIAMVDTPPNPADHPTVVGKVSSSVRGAAGAGAGADAASGGGGEGGKPLSRHELNKLGLSQLDMTRLNTLLDRGVVVDHRMLQQLGIRSQQLSGQRAMAHAAEATHPYYAAFQASKVHIEEMSSIADGHIRLTPGLKALGVNPPLDPQHSLTRIGIGSRKEIRDHRSRAMQKVATRLRIDVTSALDAVRLNSSPEEVAFARRQLAAWRAALSQEPHRPLPLHEQVVLLFVAAAYHDHPVVVEALKGGRDSLILRHMRSCSQPLLEDIRDTGDFSVASAKLLDVSIRLFMATAGTM